MQRVPITTGLRPEQIRVSSNELQAIDSVLKTGPPKALVIMAPNEVEKDRFATVPPWTTDMQESAGMCPIRRQRRC